MSGIDPTRATGDDRRPFVGRSDAWDRVTGLVFGPPGRATTVVLSGDAGIGKTTLWRAVVDEARDRGMAVLATTGAEAEAQLSLGGARDLVAAGLDIVAADLPAPQRHVLRVLLLQEDPGPRPPDRGATAAAFLALTTAVAARQPLLIAVDDVQWLDPASLAILGYTLRRLDGTPVRALLAWRDPGDASTPPAWLPTDRSVVVELGPLSFGAMVAMLRVELPERIPRARLRRIHDASGGNPLYALELARASGASPMSSNAAAGSPLPVPATLLELLRRRVRGMPAETTELLGYASALPRPTLAVLERAIGRDPMPELDPGLEAGIIDVDGEALRFRHPLLGETVYELATPATRRRIHRRLAEVIDDLEEQARHLALATDTTDTDVAARVEEAARLAFLRGSPSTAADLAANAVRLTPVDESEPGPLRRRRLAEAEYAFGAGDSGRASAILDAVLADLPPGAERARLLARRARLHHFEDDIGMSVRILRAALDEAGDDDRLRASIEEGLAWGQVMMRSDLPGAAAHAAAAVHLAERLDDPAGQAEGLAAEAVARCLAGEPWAAPMDRALALEPATLGLRVLRQPSFARAYILGCTDAFEAALDVYAELERRAARQGDESAIPSIRNHQALLALQTGRWDQAEEAIDDGEERARESGQRPSLAAILGKRALLAAWRGDPDAAESAAAESLRIAGGPHADRPAPGELAARGGEGAMWALGHAALVAGVPGEATRWLAALRETLVAGGVAEPGEMPWLVDEIEALVAADRCPEAEGVVALLTSLAKGVGRGSALAAAARGRAMVLGASGDASGERVAFDEAIGRFDALPLPLEQARTRLGLGSHHRRRHAWRDARTMLTDARDRFEVLGASGWAARASRELDRVGGRAPAGDGLSPTERQVAALAADGRTNREVAAALYLSVSTVESTLTRVYAKLGIRSRTELARRISGEVGTTIL